MACEYGDLKLMMMLCAKLYGIQNAVAEVYNLLQDNLINKEQEKELYSLVDPYDEAEYPSELWYSGNYGCTMVWNFANGSKSFVQALKEMMR